MRESAIKRRLLPWKKEKNRMDAWTEAEAGQNYKNLFCVILYTKQTKGVILPSVE